MDFFLLSSKYAFFQSYFMFSVKIILDNMGPSMNYCNECRPIGVVVLMVMLTGYLPENAKRAFYNAGLVDLHR